MKLIFTFLVTFAIAPLAGAAVTLTFDADLQGFEAQENAVSLDHSPTNGGSMKLSANGGWAGNSAKINLRANADLWAETQLAAANGGILGFDVTFVGTEQTMTANPGWFEVVAIANSTNAGSGGVGGWDQARVGLGITSDQWPLDPDSRTFSVQLPIRSSAAVADDGELWFDTVSAGWTEFHLGLNNDGAGVTSAVAYFDNVSVSANAVPEPSSALLLGLGGLLFFRRRRS